MFRAVLLIGWLGISSFVTNANETVTGREDESPQDEGYLLIEATRGQAAGRVKALESRSLSHDELTTQLGRSIAEILSLMANVDVAGGPRSMAQQLVIRGLDDSRAALVMDGIPVVYERGHDARWQVNPMLLDQIEITTGHFSGLWGSGALVGAVVGRTIDADRFVEPGESTLRLSTQVSSGSDRWSSNVTWLARDNADQLSLLYHVGASTWGDIALPNNQRLDNSGGDDQGHLLKARYRPTEADTFALLASRTRVTTDIPSNAQSMAGERNPLLATTSVASQNSMYWQHESGGWNLSAQVYRTDDRMTEGNDELSRVDETSFVQKGGHLSLAGQPDEERSVNWLMAVEYRNVTVDSSRNGQPRESFPSGEQDTKAILAIASIPFGAHILQVGGRFDDINISKTNVGTSSYAEVSPLLSLISSPTENFSWRLSVRQTFKAPTLTQLFVSGTHFTCGPGCANLFVPNPDLRPEIAKGAEIGFVWHLPSSRQTLTANVFHYDAQDFIDMHVNFAFWPVPGNPGLGGTTTYENARDARLQGWEASYKFQLDGWDWRVSVGQTRGDNLTDSEPLASVFPAKLVSTFTRQLSDDWMMQWQWKLYARQDRVPSGMSETPGYGLHDLVFAWRPMHRNTEITLRINNVFDRAWRSHNSVLPGQGRDISVRWVYQF